MHSELMSINLNIKHKHCSSVRKWFWLDFCLNLNIIDNLTVNVKRFNQRWFDFIIQYIVIYPVMQIICNKTLLNSFELKMYLFKHSFLIMKYFSFLQSSIFSLYILPRFENKCRYFKMNYRCWSLFSYFCFMFIFENKNRRMNLLRFSAILEFCFVHQALLWEFLRYLIRELCGKYVGY